VLVCLLTENENLTAWEDIKWHDICTKSGKCQSVCTIMLPTGIANALSKGGYQSICLYIMLLPFKTIFTDHFGVFMIKEYFLLNNLKFSLLLF
jgi:hypothetical protein